MKSNVCCLEIVILRNDDLFLPLIINCALFVLEYGFEVGLVVGIEFVFVSIGYYLKTTYLFLLALLLFIFNDKKNWAICLD